MNILTFDIEEWFHILDFEDTRTADQWDNYEVRIYQNVDRILDILENTSTKATFFVIGWVAKTYPDVVRRIADQYQIGTHSMSHQLVWQQSPAEFKADIESCVKTLEDITGKKVECFRAPGFSIRESEAWAFDVLAELGIKYDSSVFPAHHAHGGIPSFPDAAPTIVVHNGVELKEFPVGFKTIAGRHIVFSGGGYFRLCPYPLLHRWSSQSGNYMLAYLHPRDFDSGQPMLDNLPLKRKFKSYVGLKPAAAKLQKWLTDFEFTDIATADSLTNWSEMQRFTIH